MSEPSAAQIVAALRKAGIDVYETPGWAQRCRCCLGPHRPNAKSYYRAWGGPKGLGIHQTYGNRLYGKAAEEYAHGLLGTDGNGITPGPLCLAGIDGDGRWCMSGVGRANHMGMISRAARDKTILGTWSMTDNYDDVRGDGYDGNAIQWGLECMSKDKPNAAQLQSMITGGAVLAELADFDAGSICGHGEASNQRAYDDPNLDMGSFRRNVAAILDSSKPIQIITPESDIIMAITTANTNDFTNLLLTALKNKKVQDAIAIASQAATYGVDIDGDGLADSVGEVAAHDYKVGVVAQNRVSQLIRENKELRADLAEIKAMLQKKLVD